MSYLIPARGTVWFIAYPLFENPTPDLLIEGPNEWRRPVVALFVEDPRDIDEHADFGLAHDELIVDETGSLFRVHDYLGSLMGDDHWDHVTAIYQPHVDGPITDAPRFRIPSPPSVAV